MVLAALLHYFPTFQGLLTRSARTLQGWRRSAPPREGGPTCPEVVGTLVAGLAQAVGRKPALAAWLSYDCFMRGQDWAALRKEDVVIDGAGTVALMRGVRERGESCKTGAHQGVEVRHPVLAGLLAELRAATPAHGRVFAGLGRQEFRDTAPPF